MEMLDLSKKDPAAPAPIEVRNAAERKRIPMSVPVQKLELPELPGYHLHWFKDTPERIARALEGGYEFVEEREVKPHNVSLGGESAKSGNTDLGSRVSVASGEGVQGQAGRLVLMKLKQEWYEEDQKLVDKRNDAVADALCGGLIGSDKDASGDTQQRYLDKSRTKIPDLFKRKH